MQSTQPMQPAQSAAPPAPPVAPMPIPPQPSTTDMAPPPSASAAADDASLQVTQTLARLADLRDSGAITLEEYEAKKAELLGRL
jgi:hypothetical protein